MVFLGYALDPVLDLHGKIAVYFNNLPAETQDRAAATTRRQRTLAASGALAILSIDNPAAIEPTHWPAAYARSVSIVGTPAPAATTPTLRILV